MKRQQEIAWELAEKYHQGQYRRDGTTPYFYHVRDVARVAGDRFGFDDELIATALCHDLLEQCDISEIKMFDAGLSKTVIEAVQWLTLDENRSYEENIRAIKNSKNQLAIKVKIADNLSNLADAPTDKQILKYAKSLQILLGD